MTTKLTIKNEPDSNGDVIYHGFSTVNGNVGGSLLPGEEFSVWITNQSGFFITETWPTKKPKAV